MRTRQRASFAALSFVVLSGCAQSDAKPGVKPAASRSDASIGRTNASPNVARAPQAFGARRSVAGDSGAARVVRFAWRPPRGSAAEYAMSDALDQHRMVLTRGVARGGRYPVVIALHGQPKRGQAPREYRFAAPVMRVAESLSDAGEVLPFVLVLPVFRYAGTNWPGFDLASFRGELERRLASEGIQASGYYVVGHSAAAGCSGQGMNGAHRMAPAAVGFFDTCLGAGFGNEVRALQKAGIPTLIIHSLETAGFRPRQAREYLSTFDFGKVYGPLGLLPRDCPPRVPEAPLRPQPFRCAADADAVTRAFVIDTGEGEEGHNAVVPVAFSYFLREYVAEKR